MNILNMFPPSIANLTCTPSDRQMQPSGYMYRRLGSPAVVCGTRFGGFPMLIKALSKTAHLEFDRIYPKTGCTFPRF